MRTAPIRHWCSVIWCKAEATGEAAIFLALQQIQQQGKRLGIQNIEVSFAGQTIAVHLQPWSGLVNINRATENLWTALLIGAAQLSRPQAQVLAQAIVQQRQQQTQNAGEGLWEAPQDLLAVSGMTHAIYANLQPYLVVLIAAPRSPKSLRRSSCALGYRLWHPNNCKPTGIMARLYRYCPGSSA